MSKPHRQGAAGAGIGSQAPGARILVVDDEPSVRLVVVEYLCDLGFDTVEACDGEEGLEILSSDDRVDLVVSDIMMPGLNGRQMATAARRIRPGLPVLFITGYADDALAGPASLEPGMQVLSKPFRMATLMERVAAMLPRRGAVASAA